MEKGGLDIGNLVERSWSLLAKRSGGLVKKGEHSGEIRDLCSGLDVSLKDVRCWAGIANFFAKLGVNREQVNVNFC